jgi:hypothetical protein
MGIWLALLALIVVVVLVIYLKPHNAEGFGDFLDSQKAFGDSQGIYFHDKIDRGIFTNPGLSLNGLNDAVRQPDLYLPSSPSDDMTRFFMEDPHNAFSAEDNKQCRIVSHPRSLPVRKPGDRIGCGWYFYEDPEKMSVGALGTRDGPVIPTGLKGGVWIWNREEAIRREEIKRCKALRQCELLDFGDISRECGFCAERGHGIPIHSNGTPKYPDDPEVSCGSKIITKGSDCYEPVEEEDGGEAVTGAVDGGPGYTLRRTVTGGAGFCVSNGAMTVQCLASLMRWFGFNDKGGLFKLLMTQSPDAMTTLALQKLKETNIDLPEDFWKTRALNVVQGSWGILNRIGNLARVRDGTNEARAARFLADGTPYTPCESYTSDSRGPFDESCLQQAFRKAGCQAGGASYPNARTAVSQFANLTWGQVNSLFKKTYDDMKSTDPRTQDMALKNCLGPNSEFYREKGKTCWKCEDNIHVPIRRNAAGEIECASLDGYNCLWQANKANCDLTMAKMANLNVVPLVCGADHKRKYGSDGYSNPVHWCARAVAGGKHDKPAAGSEYEYKGCFRDNWNRAIPTYVGNVRNKEECEERAEKSGANTFGLQFFGQCFVGNNPAYNRYGPASNCGTMGTAWTNQVYSKK